MTVITRQRSENFAIIPNTLAEDDRLSFEARGLLCYLLAKPNNWKVRIADIQKSGGIGRDKAYRLIRELREAGYVKLDIKRDTNARIVQQNYIVYDCAVPEQLPFQETRKADTPLPESPEMAKLLPENTEVAKLLPENPASGKARYGKAGRINKNPYLIKLTTNNEWFDSFWNGVDPKFRPANHQGALTLYLQLPADIDRQSAIEHWPVYESLRLRRGETPCLLTYLRQRAWRDLADAPPLDPAGQFVITPDRVEWQPWLEAIQLHHGQVAAQEAKRRGKLLRTDRYPPLPSSHQLSMPIG